jgi:REP element-mobilizing transposase RayT
MQSYDYAQAGAYFVTICAADRLCIFGYVRDGKVCLSRPGEIVVEEWLAVPQHRLGVELDVFVVMPNHFHGLLLLEDDSGRGTACRARADDEACMQSAFGALSSGSLGAVVGGFKSAVARRINLERRTPGESVWQRNYYERVIRSERLLIALRQYIETNPANWDKDEEYIPGSRSS